MNESDSITHFLSSFQAYVYLDEGMKLTALGAISKKGKGICELQGVDFI